MSNLLPESLCETKQQDTITGLFQKMTAGGIIGNDESKGKQKHATSKSLFKKSKSIPRASLSEQASSDCDSVTNREASLPSSDCESMRQGMPCMTDHVTDHVTESAGEARPDAPVEDVSKEALKDHKDHQSENPQLKQFQCPVCHKDVLCKNLNYFNDHVDVCLFRQISQERELECSSDTLDDKKTEEVERAEITKTVPASSEPSKWKSKLDANAECPSLNVIQDSGFEIDSNDASSRTRNHLNKTLSLSDDSSKVETKIVQMVESEVPVPCPAAPVQCPGMEEAEFYACPVCNVEKIGCSLQDFNDHVDSCLSRRAIKQILDEQKTLQCPPGKRIHSSPNCSQQPSSKKRKSNNSSKMTTLHAFFKP